MADATSGWRRGLEQILSQSLRKELALSTRSFKLLASRPVRDYISVVLCHPVCGALSRRHQETPTDGKKTRQQEAVSVGQAELSLGTIPTSPQLRTTIVYSSDPCRCQDALLTPATRGPRLTATTPNILPASGRGQGGDGVPHQPSTCSCQYTVRAPLYNARGP